MSTDEDTIINLTNHTYFNLDGGGNVLGQKLRIYASNYLEGNNETCPTGKILPVDGTPMDFRTGKPLGRDLDTGFYQTTMAGGGFDHCYVLDRPRGASQSLCAWASSDKTGISMKMYTTQPGIQLYTGNFLQNCPSPARAASRMEKYGGFALETQHFPCSPSHPEFLDDGAAGGQGLPRQHYAPLLHRPSVRPSCKLNISRSKAAVSLAELPLCCFWRVLSMQLAD
ncbi:MAG: hypothetical protein ACLRRU_03050 [Faecalibacterium sp.]